MNYQDELGAAAANWLDLLDSIDNTSKELMRLESVKQSLIRQQNDAGDKLRKCVGANIRRRVFRVSGFSKLIVVSYVGHGTEVSNTVEAVEFTEVKEGTKPE